MDFTEFTKSTNEKERDHVLTLPAQQESSKKSNTKSKSSKKNKSATK
ncbi:MAG: hypothetical protein KDD58_04290 [Bdellovibrionales bacterium]|nr:hypothetical protein [Bdellovibrionales bacterium]